MCLCEREGCGRGVLCEREGCVCVRERGVCVSLGVSVRLCEREGRVCL